MGKEMKRKKKHAYLIIAHTDVSLLQILVRLLDDPRNDIYVHIDRKAQFDGSSLHTNNSDLFVLEERLDARWGDFSIVEVELLLFSMAYTHGSYSYYHLLSGTDLPIKSQDYIHDFCQCHAGAEYIGYAQNVKQGEIRWRSQHWFLFSQSFLSRSLWKRALRASFVKLQSVVRYKRCPLEVKKGSQWCSVTNDFVDYVLRHADALRQWFKHTYCPDELVLQTLCWNSDFKERVYSLTDEFAGCFRFIKWCDGTLQPLTVKDVETMKRSDCWFARKFSSKVTSLIEYIVRDMCKND